MWVETCSQVDAIHVLEKRGNWEECGIQQKGVIWKTKKAIILILI